MAELLDQLDVAKLWDASTEAERRTLLDQLDVAKLWDASTEAERRTLLDELLAGVTVHPDRLVVEAYGAPALHPVRNARLPSDTIAE